MPATPPKYEFTAANAQEIRSALKAAEKLLDAHLMMLSPNDTIIGSDLCRDTPARLELTIDLGPIIARITEVTSLNAQFEATGE